VTIPEHFQFNIFIALNLRDMDHRVLYVVSIKIKINKKNKKIIYSTTLHVLYPVALRLLATPISFSIIDRWTKEKKKKKSSSMNSTEKRTNKTKQNKPTYILVVLLFVSRTSISKKAKRRRTGSLTHSLAHSLVPYGKPRSTISPSHLAKPKGIPFSPLTSKQESKQA
jgi:hypothetical protein